VWGQCSVAGEQTAITNVDSNKVIKNIGISVVMISAFDTKQNKFVLKGTN
jgi:hypothetical protein